MYKYRFKLPKELEGKSSFLDRTGEYVVYSESEEKARKLAKEQAKEEYGVKLKAPLILSRRDNW